MTSAANGPLWRPQPQNERPRLGNSSRLPSPQQTDSVNPAIVLWRSLLASCPARTMNQNFPADGIPRDSRAVQNALAARRSIATSDRTASCAIMQSRFSKSRRPAVRMPSVLDLNSYVAFGNFAGMVPMLSVAGTSRLRKRSHPAAFADTRGVRLALRPPRPTNK